MGVLKFRYDESATADFLTFESDEALEFEIDDTWEASGGNAFIALVRVLKGEHKGKLSRMPFRFQIKDGDYSYSTMNFLKMFFTKAELREGMDMKRMLGKRFACVSKRKMVNGREFQNFEHFKLIDEVGGY